MGAELLCLLQSLHCICVCSVSASNTGQRSLGTPRNKKELPGYYEITPSLQNKRFFTVTFSGVFPHRCLGVRKGQGRRDLTLCINSLCASCSSQNNATHCPKHPQEQELPLESLKEAFCFTPQPLAAPYTSAGSSTSAKEGSSWSLLSKQKHQLPYPSFPFS